MKPGDDRNLGIDVLRGAAALAVLVYHARELLWVGFSENMKAGAAAWANPDTWLGAASLPFRFGGLGVALFFVISGYCIHRPHARRLARDPSYRVALGEYAFRRAWRIYPVFLAALAMTAGFDAVTRAYAPADHNLQEGDDSWQCLVLNVLTLHNTATTAYGTDSPLWTLAVEIHFYAAYPLVFWGFRRFGPTATAGAILAVNVAYLAVAQATGWPERVFLAYWFSWTIGAYVAEAELSRATFPMKLVYPAAGLGLTAGDRRLGHAAVELGVLGSGRVFRGVAAVRARRVVGSCQADGVGLVQPGVAGVCPDRNIQLLVVPLSPTYDRGIPCDILQWGEVESVRRRNAGPRPRHFLRVLDVSPCRAVIALSARPVRAATAPGGHGLEGGPVTYGTARMVR